MPRKPAMLERLRRIWNGWGLSVKFGLIYAVVLFLIILAFMVCYASLRMVQSAEKAILTSMEIRQDVFELDGQMEKTRRLYRDFLLSSPQIGYTAAHERYAHPAIVSMARLIAINEHLRGLLGQLNVSAALRRRNVDINVYLSTVKRFTNIALSQYDLFRTMANPEDGLEPQLDTTIAALKLAAAASHDVSESLREAFLLEKEFRLTRSRPVMQASLNRITQLRHTLAEASHESEPLRLVLQPLLDRYEQLADRVLECDVAIRGNAHDFDLQARAMDPIGADLKALTSAEVASARARIVWVSRLAGGIILAAALVCLVVAVGIGRLIHGSVTSRLVELTRRADRLRAEDSHPGEAAASGDELTVLDETFSAMTRRVEDLVTNLEAKVRQRTGQLDLINRELDSKNQALEVLSLTDRLTGLCNRRKLDHTLEAEIRRARRYNTPFSLIMLDLDHFKSVNDRFGHQQGDAVLTRVADTLLSLVRDTDIVGRWGGEEFLIVCPETTLKVAGRLGNRLHREIGRIEHPVAGHVTASFGVAQHRAGTETAILLAQVDAALYRAKQEGRNQVVLAAPDESPDHCEAKV